MHDARLTDALKHLHPPPGVKLWHGGATVLGCLRGVSVETAAWRPAPDRHSIWALTLHIAYWKYAVRRRITEEERGGFPRSPSNWPAVPEEPNEETWKADRQLLRDEHLRLVEALESFEAARLAEIAGDGRTSYADLVWGIVLHDAYHVGQIQMLKRMHRSQSTE